MKQIQMNPFLTKRQNSSGSVALATSFVLFFSPLLLPPFTVAWCWLCFTYIHMYVAPNNILLSFWSFWNLCGTVVFFTQLYVCRISTWYFVVLDSSEFSLLCDIPVWIYHLFFYSSVDSFQYFSFLKDIAVDFLRLSSISLHVQMFLYVTV